MAVAELEKATKRLGAARSQVRESEARVAALERAAGERATWDGTHGWRLGDVTRIQAELDHHRASVILGAVRQGDPLAFGINRLRSARATYVDDLSAIEAALPPDRSRELALAKARVASGRRALGDARVRRDEAEQALAVAQERHWGRKDKTAIRSATARLDHTAGVMRSATHSLARDVKDLAAERALAKERDAAVAAVAPERARLESVVRELDLALDTTRPERVVAIAIGLENAEPIRQALGPLPDERRSASLVRPGQRDREGSGPGRLARPGWHRRPPGHVRSGVRPGLCPRVARRPDPSRCGGRSCAGRRGRRARHVGEPACGRPRRQAPRPRSGEARSRPRHGAVELVGCPSTAFRRPLVVCSSKFSPFTEPPPISQTREKPITSRPGRGAPPAGPPSQQSRDLGRDGE